MQHIPTYSKDLITLLNEYYPERCPNTSMTEREIWTYAGKRELVRNLKLLLERQQEEYKVKET